jgi:hypothetical protein
MVEAMTVNDRIYHRLEGNHKAEIAARRIFQNDMDTTPTYPVEPTVTDKAEQICTEPLPMLGGEEEESDDEESSGMFAFDNIEDAGKYFSKYPFSAWTW